jgi:lactate oxidase
MNPSRRDVLRLAGTGLATATLSLAGLARAQVKEEAENEPVTITRKGIDRYIDVINIDLLEEQAKVTLSQGVYVFIAHGQGEQWTLRENRRAFDDYAFTPDRMHGIVRETIDTSVTLLGQRFPHPIFISPMGSHGLVHVEGEVATAEGVAKSDGLLCVSSASTRAMEDIAKATPLPKWFQMYLTVDEGESRDVLQRVRAAGFRAVILTVDAIGQGSSDEYVRLGHNRPWLPYGNFPTGNANAFKTDLSWKDFDFIGKVTGLPVVVKGITTPQDALEAVKAGAAAIQVSNHGGRALDGTPAAITVLPHIAEAVKGAVPIIMDGGVRRGTDVVKALALGANAVAIGRPMWWALTVGGPGGVAGVLDYFQRETANTMLHCGASSIRALGRAHVQSVNQLQRVPSPSR